MTASDINVAQAKRRRRIPEPLRLFLLNVRSVVLLPFGVLHYVLTGRTPARAYQALVWLFCSTGGRSNDWLSRVIARWRPKIALRHARGVLGDMSGPQLTATAERLRSDGCVVFERALPAAVCDRLAAFAAETPATVRRMDHEPVGTKRPVVRFDAASPLGVRYDYALSDLLDNADVQALLADPSILALTQEYLGCSPVADVLSMWWHTGFHAQPDSEAAQYFHFDLDRIKWLKIFVYLTDVGPDNGPHCFVRGSQGTGAIPAAVLQRGYVRLTDDEVFAHFPRHDCLSIAAPRGSIIVEDTRGLHKGSPVIGDPRLILQLQFSNSLFGTHYPRAQIGAVKDPGLEEVLARNPSVYAQYTK